MSVPTKRTESGVDDSVLPPGQRDDSGFWYPAGYSDPRTLVRPRRRRRKSEMAVEENGPADEADTDGPGH